MSNNPFQQNHQATHLSGTLSPGSYEELMTWRMRWYLIIAITSTYAASLVVGLISYRLTHDPYYLLFLTPTVLIPFVYYLVPMDKKRFELKMAKINAAKGSSDAKSKKTQLLPRKSHSIEGRENPQGVKS